MNRLLPLMLGAWMLAALAAAQSGELNWITDPQQAVREAQNSGRLLMVYVLSSMRDRDNDLEQAQKRAMSDPRVHAIVNRSFVPLKLSRSANRDQLKDFGLSETANMMMSFVSPEGRVLGDISANGLTQADSLVQKLESVLEVYRKQIYETEIKPKLEDPKTPPDGLKGALSRIGSLRIAGADKDVLALLKREKLDAGVRTAAYDALGVLSTKAAVTALLEAARAGDGAATKALEKGTPAAAELLLEEISKEGAFDYELYRIIGKICQIRSMKDRKFFEKAKPDLQAKELDRVAEIVARQARQDKERTHGR